MVLWVSNLAPMKGNRNFVRLFILCKWEVFDINKLKVSVSNAKKSAFGLIIESCGVYSLHSNCKQNKSFLGNFPSSSGKKSSYERCLKYKKSFNENIYTSAVLSLSRTLRDLLCERDRNLMLIAKWKYKLLFVFFWCK